jgi:hypothetical protein
VNGPGDDTNGAPGTGQPPAVPDLADLDALCLVEPEYVLAYIPPQVRARSVFPGLRSLFPGMWALLTVAEWKADCPPPETRLLPGFRAIPVPLLAWWAQRELGYPVALEPGSFTLRAARPFGRLREEPLYQVRRNT